MKHQGHPDDAADLRPPLPALKPYELTYYPGFTCSGALVDPTSNQADELARTADVIVHGLTGDLVVGRFEREKNRMVVNCRRLQSHEVAALAPAPEAVAA